MADSDSDNDRWTVTRARARFSEVVKRAATGRPQEITSNGKRVAILTGVVEKEQKPRRTDSLAEFLMSSPLRGSDLEIERVAGKPRNIDL